MSDTLQYGQKRALEASLTDAQAGNRSWWSSNTMSYDFTERHTAERFSLAWYDEMDRRFLFGARLFNQDANPFPRLMGADQLAGKRVLEIGCGMGFHAELLARAGAELTAIDLSPASIEATTRRLALKGLKADVREMDAESLDFPDGTFDLVWSWGVIHHSASTGRIIRDIHRVTAPGGSAKIMVYHLDGMQARIALLRRVLSGFSGEIDEALWRGTDGYSARFYSRDGFADLLRTFFDVVTVDVYGQDTDAVPLPRRLRRLALRVISEEYLRHASRRRGTFLMATARKA